MFLKELEVRNFKSFESLNVKFDDLNILIGANASGKSNFISIFTFLKNIAQNNLQDAFSWEGGIEYLRNIRIGNKDNLLLKIKYDPNSILVHKVEDGQIRIKISEAVYEFEIYFFKRGKGLEYRIEKDILTVQYEFIKIKRGTKLKEAKKLGRGSATYRLNKGFFSSNIKMPANMPFKEDVLFPFKYRSGFPEKSLFLGTPFFGLAHNWISSNQLSNIPIYDFDSKLSQTATSITGKTELEEDGSNLSLVLKNILSNAEQKRKFMNLISYLLPFIDAIKVTKQTERSFLFALREKHSSEYLPAFLLSDGTINLTALIIALYFTNNPMLIFEEPGRTIHPSLIGKVVELLQEVSVNKQIIITTHNPEIVRHAPIKNLMLISRDKQGFSQIIRPVESKRVEIFMQNEIGIQDLYVQNLLGV